MICSSYVTTRSLSVVPGSSLVVAPVAMMQLSKVSVSVATRTELDGHRLRVVERGPAVVLGDLVLLHQEVDALDAAVGDDPAALEGGAGSRR